MASPFPVHVSAVQVGGYFVGQYYQYLQQKPDYVHQFYSDASTMVRSDGAAAETATGMLQIHNLIMSLNFMSVEIKTAQSLESWHGGVLVMVSGLMQTKDYNARRNFLQTFFLAPQERGYFVLNDIFHFLEEEHLHELHQHPAGMLTHSNYETNLSATGIMHEPGTGYILREEIQARNFTPLVRVKENEIVDEYAMPEPQQQVSEAVDRTEETPAEVDVVSFPNITNTMNTMRDPPPALAVEPAGEPPKKTYASILRVAKGQTGHSMPHQASINKIAPSASERHHVPQTNFQQSDSTLSSGPDKFSLEASEEVAPHEDEGDARSVYVGNLPSSVRISDIEQEFKNFGRIRPDGVTIRSRKETGAFYAFVEFEDADGVQNAIKASPVELHGRLIHVEGRRPNSGASRGRRGRGRGGTYKSEAPRGRFGGRTYGGRGGDFQDNGYTGLPRGNGYIQRVPRAEKGILGNQYPRNGYSPSES